MKNIHKLLKDRNITILFFQTQLLLKLSKTQLVLLADNNYGNKDGFWHAVQEKHGISPKPLSTKKWKLTDYDLPNSTSTAANPYAVSSPCSVARLGIFDEQQDVLEAAKYLMALHNSTITL